MNLNDICFEQQFEPKGTMPKGHLTAKDRSQRRYFVLYNNHRGPTLNAP